MAGEIDRRLEFIRMDGKSRNALKRLKPFLDRSIGPSLDQFYGQVRQFPEVRVHFKTDGHIDHAKSAQARHWNTISTGEFDENYLKAARAIGQVHARLGIEPQWYIGGYALMLQELVGATVRANWPKGLAGVKLGIGSPEDLVEMVGAIIKAALLDMDIVMTEYREASESERKRLEAVQHEQALQQQFVVEQLTEALTRLREGDLTFRLNEPFGAALDPLRLDFNEAMAGLKQTIAVVASNADAIRHGADEIGQAADDLSRRTEQQAASLEETAAALDQITATVKRTSESANQASRVVTGARSDAERSGQVVRDAVEAMSRIETSARQISQIIGVIDEIAFQTNLLALNAGVEAARAGDAGRGFAVVASEVRALAQRSAEAAKEIKALISTSSQEVASGVDLVGQTGEALTGIVEKVAEISDLVIEIAASAKEQASGLNEVNAAVNQMDTVTQQNAAMVEQSTAASHALAVETETLSQQVAQFNIGDAPVARRKAAVVAPVRTQPKARRVGGSAAVAAAPAAEGDAWEEF